MAALQNVSSLPKELADMCDCIAFNNTVCQGFTYNSGTKLAIFKGHTPLEAIDLSSYIESANNSTLWWLSAGEPCTFDIRTSNIQMPSAYALLQYLPRTHE